MSPTLENSTLDPGAAATAVPACEDPQLGTGRYDPERYWSARADRSSDIESVCIFGASQVENRAADRVQRRTLHKLLASRSLAGAEVLEYGCGIGRWSSLFRAARARWHGVDLSAAMCERAAANSQGADVRKVDGLRIPHDADRFDLVYSVTVLHHNPHPDQERILDEMLRVLRPGGTLLLFEDLGERGSFNMFPRSLRGWGELLASRGFEMVERRTVRYSIVRSALARLRARCGDSAADDAAVADGSSARPRQSALRRLVDRVDALVGPYLTPWLPEAWCTAAAMVFRQR